MTETGNRKSESIRLKPHDLLGVGAALYKLANAVNAHTRMSEAIAAIDTFAQSSWGVKVAALLHESDLRDANLRKIEELATFLRAHGIDIDWPRDRHNGHIVLTLESLT